MKNRIQLIALCFFLLSIFSCKKKYDKEFIGPQAKEEVNFSLVNSLEPGKGTEINFDNPIPVFFKASFDKSITWKLTITGDSSGAVKTFVGTSAVIDSLTSTWKGEQDSLYYFTKETCKVTLSDYYPLDKNAIYNTLAQNSTIIEPKVKLTTSISIKIVNPRLISPDALLLFDRKHADYQDNQFYRPGYDSESNQAACNLIRGIESDPSIRIDPSDPTSFGIYSVGPLVYAKNSNPICRWYWNEDKEYYNSKSVYILKGADISNNDYYIGRIERVLTGPSHVFAKKFFQNHPNLDPNNVWFNVFVYGIGDGAKLNYSIKEDDDADGVFNKGLFVPCNAPKKFFEENKYGAKDKTDDAFEKAITLDFKGWKLFSFRYTDFTAIKDGINGNGIGEYNPNRLLSAQFSLVAPDKGKSGQAIFDYPVMTIGGPLKY